MEHLIKKTSDNSSNDCQRSPPVEARHRTTSKGLPGCIFENQTTFDSQNVSKNDESKIQTNYRTGKVNQQPLTSLRLTKPLDYRPSLHRDNSLVKSRLNLNRGETVRISKGNPKRLRTSDKFFQKNRFLGPGHWPLPQSWNRPEMRMVPLRQRFDQLSPWRRCQNHDHDVWSVRSKLKPLGFRPSLPTDLHGDFGTKLRIRGNELGLSKRFDVQNGLMESGNVLLKRENIRDRNVCNSPVDVQWADAFAKPTVLRLNELVVSLTEESEDAKFRPRRMQCSTCFYYV